MDLTCQPSRRDRMAKDPYDPSPDSDWPKYAFAVLIAVIIIGVWWWASQHITSVFQQP